MSIIETLLSLLSVLSMVLGLGPTGLLLLIPCLGLLWLLWRLLRRTLKVPRRVLLLALGALAVLSIVLWIASGAANPYLPPALQRLPRENQATPAPPPARAPAVAPPDAGDDRARAPAPADTAEADTGSGAEGEIASAFSLADGEIKDLKAEPSSPSGPYPSMDALCAALEKAEAERVKRDCTEPDSTMGVCCLQKAIYRCPKKAIAQFSAGLPAPMSELRVFWTHRFAPDASDCEGEPEHRPEGWNVCEGSCGSLIAVLRVGGAWYSSPLGAWRYQGSDRASAELSSTEVQRVGSGGQALVVLRVSQSDSQRWLGSSEDRLSMLGIGRGGKPARLDVAVGHSNTGWVGEGGPMAEDSSETEHRVSYDYRFAGDALLLTSQTAHSQVGELTRERTRAIDVRIPLSLP